MDSVTGGAADAGAGVSVGAREVGSKSGSTVEAEGRVCILQVYESRYPKTIEIAGGISYVTSLGQLFRSFHEVDNFLIESNEKWIRIST